MFKRMMMVALLVGLVGFVFATSAVAADAVRVAGQLTKIDGKALTITTDGKDTVITCNDATKISRDGAGPVKFEDLQVGQPVRAYYTEADNVAGAVIIAKAPGEAPAPAPAANTARVAGQLSKIDGKALTITADGKDTVITCNDATKFSRDGAGPVKFEDLQVDQQVRAYYTKADNVAGAVIIAKAPGEAPAPAPATNTARVAGQLTKIDGKTLTITDDATKDTVITCNDATKISRDGVGPVKFEDLEVGQPVRAYYTKADNVAGAVIIAKPPAEK